MTALVIVVVVIAFFVVVPKLVGRTISSTDRLVRRNTHQEGRELMTTGLHFDAPLPAVALKESVRTAVDPHMSPLPVVPGLYLKSQSATELLFGFGSRLSGDSFIAAYRFSDTTGGCTGHFQVLSWKESGADVMGKGRVRQLHERIGAAVRDSGGTVRVIGGQTGAANAPRVGRPSSMPNPMARVAVGRNWCSNKACRMYSVSVVAEQCHLCGQSTKAVAG